MTPLNHAQAVVYGELVNAAYAMYEADPDNLTPQPKDIPSGFAMVAWIHMSDFAFLNTYPKFYGFVAQSILNPATHVVVIRGTQGLIEWYDDAMIVKTPFTQVPNAGEVASGFDNIYGTLKVVKYTPPPPGARLEAAAAPVADATPLSGSFAEQIAQVVGSTEPSRALHADLMGMPETPAPAVAITGHSLGSALCTLYVMENAAKGLVHNPVICTFASPRVGDQAFVDAFNKLPGVTSWHIKNTWDIVPKLPPALLGYGDVDQLYEFNSWGMVGFSPSCWHSMLTYMHWLDPKVQLDPNCVA
jgi:predicted lipase